MQLENEAIQNAYDPRWFIWTIVFLVTTGVMLVTYITTTNASEDNVITLDATATRHKIIKK